MNVSTVFSVVFGWFILSFAGYSMWNVMVFFSGGHPASEQNLFNNNTSSQSENVFLSLWCNACLILLFIGQHSFLKTKAIGDYLSRNRLSPSVARSFYVLLTSLTLQAMVFFWMPTHSYNIWKLDTSSSFIWWIFSLAHFLAWASIYGGAVLLDLPELVGVKQIYYYYLNVMEPSDLKSTELKRLYSHKRHPSFLAFLIILWVIPVMSLDRLLLAVAFSLYTATAWEPTVDDRRYHKQQLTQKTEQIDYTTRRRVQKDEIRNFRG